MSECQRAEERECKDVIKGKSERYEADKLDASIQMSGSMKGMSGRNNAES